MYFIVLTNNPLVIRSHRDLKPVLVEGDAIAVYKKARDLVHKGHRLLTHPLSGNVKPGAVPYRTLVLSADAGKTVDLTSLNHMAAAMEAAEATRSLAKRTFSPPLLNDYATVDLSIFESALLSLLP